MTASAQNKNRLKLDPGHFPAFKYSAQYPLGKKFDSLDEFNEFNEIEANAGIEWFENPDLKIEKDAMIEADEDLIGKISQLVDALEASDKSNSILLKQKEALEAEVKRLGDSVDELESLLEKATASAEDDAKAKKAAIQAAKQADKPKADSQS